MIWAFLLVIALPVYTGLNQWAGLTTVLPPPRENVWIAVLIVAPLLEECIFRAGLRSPTWCLGLSLPLLVGYSSASWPLAASMLAIVALAGAWAWTFKSPVAVLARRRAFVQRYPWVFWTYAMAFGVAHASNFTAPGLASVLTLAVVTPQILGGILLGYLRLRGGLASALALHMVHNCAGYVLSPYLPV